MQSDICNFIRFICVYKLCDNGNISGYLNVSYIIIVCIVGILHMHKLFKSSTFRLDFFCSVKAVCTECTATGHIFQSNLCLEATSLKNMLYVHRLCYLKEVMLTIKIR